MLQSEGVQRSGGGGDDSVEQCEGLIESALILQDVGKAQPGGMSAGGGDIGIELSEVITSHPFGLIEPTRDPQHRHELGAHVRTVSKRRPQLGKFVIEGILIGDALAQGERVDVIHMRQHIETGPAGSRARSRATKGRMLSGGV